MKVIKVRYGDGSCILRGRGSLTLGEGTAAFRSAVLWAQDCGGPISIDLSEVGKIDCAGLGELVRCAAIGAERGQPLRILGISNPCLELMMLTKLAIVFDFGDSGIKQAA